MQTTSNWFKMEIYLLDNVSVSPFSLHISSVQTNDNDNKHLVVFDISCGINAFKCNLKELTTKSAWVPRSAFFGMRMPGGWLHRSCDSLARSVFPSCWVLSAIFYPFRPPTRLVGFFSTDVFFQCDGCLFLSFAVGAHGWVALLCQSWGHYFNLGAGCQ